MPSGGEDDAFEVRIVGSTTSGESIVARRIARFVAHEQLTIPVILRGSCADVPCAADESCVQGACVSAEIQDVGSCASAGCREDVLLASADGDAGALEDVSVTRDVAVPEASTPSGGDSQSDSQSEAVAPDGGFHGCPEMMLLVDISGSMDLDGRWDGAKIAIQNFLSADRDPGARISLSYFPLRVGDIPNYCSGDASCNGWGTCEGLAFTCSTPDSCYCSDTCEAISYTSPILPLSSVPLLTGLSELLGKTAGGRTPTRPAVEGSLAYLQLNANPTYPANLVLITDGEPDGCTDNTIPDVEALVAAGNPAVRTHVISIGVIQDVGNIAIAGGGRYDSVPTNNVQNGVEDALTRIFDAVRCN
ncbi:MAG: VWA domain-containing protein [Polyangiaceae bacterium]|nr:VWA domain-containing protein [Polyangiaceae bacterium]